MKKIEEITFKLENGSYNCFKVYRYEEQTTRKIKVKETDEIIDAKIYITKYAIHREVQTEGKFQHICLCETESYTIILKLLKDIIESYIDQISK